MKKLVFIFCLTLSITAIAQRDINHWQLSLMGGGYYFNEAISSTLDDVNEPGYYALGLRIQKRLGTDFQLGLSIFENRFREDFDSGARSTNLSLAYNWDNGYLFSQRAVVSPYHLVSAGLRTLSTDTDVNLENTTGMVSLENGLKIRLGDDWSTQLAFVYNWYGENEKFEAVFNSETAYGIRVGLSFHFGQVRTNYNGPVFNAGRSYGQDDLSYQAYKSNYAYLALNGQIARDLTNYPAVDSDPFRAKRGLEVMSSDGITSSIYRNDSLFQLLGDQQILDSLYENRGDVVKISTNSLNSLKTAPQQNPDEGMSFDQNDQSSTEKSEALIDNQNRLIENQNDFIRMLLYYEQNDSIASDHYSQPDSSFTVKEYQGWKSADFMGDTTDVYTEEDSAALDRVTSVDTAHVTQWDEELIKDDNRKNKQYQDSLSTARDEDEKMGIQAARAIENGNDTLKSAESNQLMTERETNEDIADLQNRIQNLEEENQDLREESQKYGTELNDAERAELNELKRRNDLLEDQINATNKLAEKRIQPNEVVIEDNRSNDRGGVNLQPGLVVPIGGGNRKSDKATEALLENQQRMQARIDSLTYVLADLKAEKKYSQGQPDTTGTSAGQDTAPADTTSADSLATDFAEMDTTATLALTDSSAVMVDPIPEPDTEEVSMAAEDTLSSETEAVENRPDEIAYIATYPVKVYFDLNSSKLSYVDQEKLKKTVDDLQNHPENRIRLEGHTDKSGDQAYNEMLSRKRAAAVEDFFLDLGVDKSRIVLKPVGSKFAEEQFSQDSRRVDVILLEN